MFIKTDPEETDKTVHRIEEGIFYTYGLQRACILYTYI